MCLWLHVRRRAALGLLAVLLAGCGVMPLGGESEPATGSTAPSAVASSRAEPSAAPLALASAPSRAPSAAASVSAPATAVPSAKPSPSAAVSPAPSPAQAGWLEGAYTPLVLLEAAALAIEEAARQLEGNPTLSAELFTQLIASGVLVGITNAALAEDPPIAELAPVWNDARSVGQQLDDVVRRWTGQEITATEVAAELETLTPRIESIVQTAEAELAAAYGVDAAELQRLREQTIAQLEQALASAAPRASTAP